MAVTLTQLAAFVAVMRRGSVTAAARELVVTQSSVSAAVASLERELGVRLTERAGRTVRLTPAGEAYVPYAADVLGLLAQGARAAREADAGAGRTLRIGALTTAAEHLAPSLIRAFREHHPELDIRLDVGNRSDVLARLARHEFDVAITGRVPDDGRLRAVPFAENAFALFAAAHDPLAARTRVEPHELEARPWLVREVGSGTRAVSDGYLTSHGLHPPLMTLGSNAAVAAAVRLGLGIALQSLWAMQLELQLGLVRTISPRDGLPRRTWYVVHSAVGPVRREVTAFVRFARSGEARRALTLAVPSA